VPARRFGGRRPMPVGCRLGAQADDGDGRRAVTGGLRKPVECAGMVRDDNTSASIESIRLDVWLDVSCLFKTRSEAQRACKAGKIAVNRQPARQNRLLRRGDELEINRPYGRKQRIIVRSLEDRHVSKARARELYEDLTPAPTPEEIAAQKIERIYRAAVTPPRAPDKRERRALRRLRGRD